MSPPAPPPLPHHGRLLPFSSWRGSCSPASARAPHLSPAATQPATAPRLPPPQLLLCCSSPTRTPAAVSLTGRIGGGEMKRKMPSFSGPIQSGLDWLLPTAPRHDELQLNVEQEGVLHWVLQRSCLGRGRPRRQRRPFSACSFQDAIVAAIQISPCSRLQRIIECLNSRQWRRTSLRPTARQAKGNSSSSTAPLVSTANGSVLPQDLLYEILVRIPAKPLCRLRAVCRSWRSLLSDSSFVTAHNTLHGPLVASFKWEPSGIHILDRSGNTVRHIRFETGLRSYSWIVACSNLDVICRLGVDECPRLIDPATGVISLLPDDSEFNHNKHTTSFGFGRASSTGETKVLAITARLMTVRCCKVLTLGGAGEWRETAYDLQTEQWRPDLVHLPLPVRCHVSLAELSDNLVAVYNHNVDSHISKDLWFLTDAEKLLWSKRYTITMPYPKTFDGMMGRWADCLPLWKLDDGKIVFWVSLYLNGGDVLVVHFLRVYDPPTNTYTDGTDMPGYTFFGVYKGSLLAGHPWTRNQAGI
ncbi:hypothetical protein QYE76_062174 [Lolium multiflorum]|uniref:F-box domain-containing protein n=1 Tax=Lolium multiflorum TaxID=4521 RepID=A0AAD8S2H9_LOLMU|nr:hypothetical protein QYE76_062174 [Lolium multiflorum]